MTIIQNDNSDGEDVSECIIELDLYVDLPKWQAQCRDCGRRMLKLVKIQDSSDVTQKKQKMMNLPSLANNLCIRYRSRC